MITLVLGVALALAVGGCVCVVWASRGGPRWVRAVAALTLGAGDVVRRAEKNRRRGRTAQDDGGSGD
ncbi:hypothetical protein OOK31_24365 [Streptomyces sp. NBC_00249]|uniref:hypothetical protein n=1 Tax=Streptomyces sp. NBC_00249 TaxID=2975690 RepID=UPI00224DA421|nr:hypothetical protein [Streptomyces sp. NBC_00249]MCX5196991.1 hypothetical protein [Streptomyces sp. NBC_00249]